MKLLTTLLVTALLFSGCGYTNPYAPSTDGEDDRIPLYLEMWHDETNLLGYQAVIQRSLVHWLKKSKNSYLLMTFLMQAIYSLVEFTMQIFQGSLMEPLTELLNSGQKSDSLINSRSWKII